ncbi:MAG: hypothetical protein LBV32_05075 [Tannerellaceae bacterium]|jgi:hypothetical protein|nr:hypothetical protein [Tannerellaceae bacterium]
MRIKYILLLLTSVAVFSCCEKEVIEETSTRTVLVYMVASNLDTYLKDNIEEMIKSATDRNLKGGNLIVFYSDYNSMENTISGELYQIKEGKGGVVTKHFLRDYNGQSAVDPAFVRKLADEVFAEFPADSYGMIFSSHATAWFPSDYKNMLRWFGEENGKYIEIDDLASALKGLPLEFIAFDACSMGAVECAYELRDCANYFISSTSEIMGIGFPLKEMLPWLFTSVPDYRNIVRSFHDFFLNYKNPYGSLSVIKTEGLDELASISREILSTKGMDGMYGLNTNNYQLLSNISGNPKLYDFADIMLALASTEDQKNRLSRALENTVIAKSVTDEIYCSSGGSSEVTSYCGLTIYPLRQNFPTVNDWYHTNLSWAKYVYP